MEIEVIFLDIGNTLRSTADRLQLEKENIRAMVELFRRGYRLGIISSAPEADVAELLRELEISGCFEIVVPVTSEPSFLTYQEAASSMGVAPDKCVYVCTHVDQGGAAACAAGFSTIPGGSVQSLRDLLAVFPPRLAPQPEVVYDVALSTMYAIRKFPALSDFFEFARRAGFAWIELNHKITSAMLEGISLEQYPIRSIHEPCPADIGEAELKERGWLISSTDETCRVEGVKAMKRSIDLASRVHAKAIVIHAGEAIPDTQRLERKLRRMIDAGERGTDEYEVIRKQMIALRKEHAAAGFESVKKSIADLLEYAAPHGICLGLENRYHYLEFPSPGELESLLRMAGPDQVGFLYDSGHAYTLDALGFYPHQEWLERFSGRMIGTHLHDLRNTTDHFAPGLGTVNYAEMAPYLPSGAFRTCELQTFNSPEQVKASLKLLAEQGCIRVFSQD